MPALLIALSALLLAIGTAYVALLCLSPAPARRSPAETLFTSAAHPPSHPGQLTPLDDPPQCSLSVIVPAYNERDRLPGMVDEAVRFLLDEIHGGGQGSGAWYGDGVEIVIVDDGSTDDTCEVALDLAKKWDKTARGKVEIRVVALQRNRGKGGAVRHVSAPSAERSEETSTEASLPERSEIVPQALSPEGPPEGGVGRPRVVAFAERASARESRGRKGRPTATRPSYDGRDSVERSETQFAFVERMRAREPWRRNPSEAASRDFSSETAPGGRPNLLLHGVLFSRGSRILFADADGASTFSDLTLLERAMDELVATETGSGKAAAAASHAIVVGSRAHMVNSDAVVQRSFLRNLLMRAFHIFLRTLGVRGVKDTQCGFKVRLASLRPLVVLLDADLEATTAIHARDRAHALPHASPAPLVIRRRAPPSRTAAPPAYCRGQH
ncbi:hypothetical protein QFC19_009193 [Naganishia cerealis]|uniref:Uncharacterized protein n=1 Tax=Naganishia cerealis TaxID=610337 RepID=A0ACC2UWQ0_9TREE|nr:hypothetical protein QFC19_009193 [Naganishia cerealis]